jgi:uncharacterized cupredoxin-like copper-binding protein
MNKIWIPLGTSIALALLLVACGGGNAASTHLSVNLMEFTFNPSNLTVPAGQEISLDLKNNGAVTHDFIIMNQGADIGADFGEEDAPNVYWQAEQAAGTSGTYTFTAPSQPGEYQIVCGVKGHYQAGMVAKLNVVAP